MINKVTLIGNLGKDPEIRHFEGGSKVTQFSVATNENYQDRNNEWQTKTEWHRIVCWGAMAERAEKQLKKGGLVFIEGKISSRKWQDKEGVERTSVDIVAATFRSLERRESGASGSLPDPGFPSPTDRFQSNASPATPAAPATPITPAASSSDTSSVDDDLPF